MRKISIGKEFQAVYSSENAHISERYISNPHVWLIKFHIIWDSDMLEWIVKGEDLMLKRMWKFLNG